jgi:hypothetical protein
MPLVVGAAWLVIVRSTGRHLLAVRAVGGIVASSVMPASLVVLISELAGPMGEYSVFPFAGVIAVGSGAGLWGIVLWHGALPLILRWVGMVFVMVVPIVLFDAGLLGVAAGLPYAPALQRAQPV